MSKTLVFSAICFLSLFACRNKNAINTRELDEYIIKTDSLNKELSSISNSTLNGIYHLIDDSILADSVSKLVTLPENTLFYQLLQTNISEINELFYDAQQEIYFAQDQLKGLKEDAVKKEISNVQYEMQLELNKSMYFLLKSRTDSCISVVKNISDILLLSPVDSISNEE